MSNTSVSKSTLLSLATYASVAVAVVLIIAKLIAWLLSGSVSVLASLVDSIMDACASLINLFAVRYALMPADDDHRFGHGKAEALAGLGQAAFICGSAIALLVHAIERVRHPEVVVETGVGLTVILFAMVATLALLVFQRYVIKQTNSPAIKADALHYATDLITNGATLLALYLADLGFSQFDPYIAIAIAFYILYSAGQIVLASINMLMDRELPETERAAILKIAQETPGTLSVHGLRTWQSGVRKVIQMHLELAADISLREAHRIAVQVEENIMAYEPNADITIHQDPQGAHPHQAFELDETIKH